MVAVFSLSCATKYDPKSNKAVLNDMTGEIVWNKEKYNMSFWSLQYEADKMFLDDKKTQKIIKESNDISSKSLKYLFGGTGLAILYLLINREDDRNTRELVYYSIFAGVGFAPYIYLQLNREKMVKEGIDNYNERNNFTLTPKNLPLGIKYSIAF